MVAIKDRNATPKFCKFVVQKMYANVKIYIFGKLNVFL